MSEGVSEGKIFIGNLRAVKPTRYIYAKFDFIYFRSQVNLKKLLSKIDVKLKTN